MLPKSTLLGLTASIAVLIILLGNSGGAPAGRTGAPDEETCATSSCHAGTVNSGSATIALALADDITEYTPGSAVTVNISLTSAQNANKNGFEILALDGEGNNFGTWQISDADNTQTRSGGGGREYITHTRAGNATSSWEVQWSAPEGATDSVFFYLAVNDANNDGGRMGDNIYTTSLAVPAAGATSLDLLDAATVSIYPNPVSDYLNITSNRYSFDQFNLYDANGKQVRSGNFRPELDVSALANGLYTLQLTGSEGQLIKRIQVVR